MSDKQLSRAARYGKTSRKHVTLTNEAIEVIEVYASCHNMTFRVAIETLAVLGMNGEATQSLSRVLAGMVDSIPSRYLERQANLSAQAAPRPDSGNGGNGLIGEDGRN